jgi:hypothetical protein
VGPSGRILALHEWHGRALTLERKQPQIDRHDGQSSLRPHAARHPGGWNRAGAGDVLRS